MNANQDPVVIREQDSVALPGDPLAKTDEADQAALIALFRLLMRQPDTGHDFETCHICKRYGIASI